MPYDGTRVFVHPGIVVSIHDGQEHHITADRLADLYGVQLRLCFVINQDQPMMIFSPQPNDIHLYPRHDGDYPRAVLWIGEPCAHPGCLAHRTHACEGCGRVARQGIVWGPSPLEPAVKSLVMGVDHVARL